MNDPTDVLGRRVAAGLLDLLVVLGLLVVVGVVLGDAEAADGSASVSVRGGAALLWAALALAYYFLTEAATGRTLGKRLLGLRVATAGGGSPSTGQVAVRTLLRLVDGLAFYLVGLVVLLATGSRRQRLGDLAARTVVVRAG